MRYRIAIAVGLAVVATIRFAHAADPRYPDWPCAQAKVPEISLAAVWAGPPLDDVSSKWKDDAKVSALVAKLAARRTPLDEAQKAITEYLNAVQPTRPQAESCCLPACSTPQCPALPGHERAGARDPQAARSRRKNP